jgi:hypothetical protein
MDILLDIESVLSNLDLYTFKYWFDSEVVDGPVVGKYLITIKLLFNNECKPEKISCELLAKHGIKVLIQPYKKKVNKEETKNFWLVTLSIPKRIIEVKTTRDMEDMLLDIEMEDILQQHTIKTDEHK